MATHRLTRGAVLFSDWLEKQPKRERQKRTAELLGVTQQTVSKVARGAFIPSAYALVDGLREHCGVPPDAWLTLTRFHAPKAVPRKRLRRAA